MVKENWSLEHLINEKIIQKHKLDKLYAAEFGMADSDVHLIKESTRERVKDLFDFRHMAEFVLLSKRYTGHSMLTLDSKSSEKA